jgi:murein DD-endopeptidase MepM/ murein hydrolase activator NlpD
MTESEGIGKLLASAVIGGTASQLNGGKFENGALSAAFGYLFNEAADRIFEKSKREVVAVEAGVVVQIGWENPEKQNQGFGFRIKIRNIDGDTIWIYAHMEPTTKLYEGMLVLEGDVIGRYSMTINGNSTGPHLHLEARDERNQPYLDQGDVMPVPGGRLSSGIQAHRQVRTNNGLQSRPHNGTDWVATP